MNKKTILKTYFLLLCFSVIAFVAHFFLVKAVVPETESAQWHYSVAELYGVFFVFSFVIMSILLLVRKKNLDYVGYTFLIITSVKMALAYFLVRPVLATSSEEVSFEKINFFTIFICFLAIETLLTIRILNNKQ